MSEKEFVARVDQVEDQLNRFFRFKTSTDYEDLKQQTLANAWANRDKLKNPEIFDRWIISIAKNVWNNHMRAHHALKRSAEREAEAHLDDIPDEDFDMVQAMTNKELWDKLKAFIPSLPTKQRQDFLPWLAQHTYEDISRINKKPMGTVKANVHFAVKRIVAHLKGGDA